MAPDSTLGSGVDPHLVIQEKVIIIVDTTRITTTTTRAIKTPIINISSHIINTNKPIQTTTNTKPILGITMVIIRKATIIMAKLFIKFYCHIEIFEYSRSEMSIYKAVS